MVDNVTLVTYPSLPAHGSRRGVNASLDYGALWDASASPAQLANFPGRWFYDLGSTKIYNLVLDGGADDTGVIANSGQALADLLSLAPSGSLILIPPGTYNLSDILTGFSTTSTSLRIVGIGNPKLDFGGGFGIQLQANQTGLQVEGVHFYNVRRYVLAVDASTRQIRGARVSQCTFESLTELSGAFSVTAVDFTCPCRDVLVSDCKLISIVGSSKAFGVKIGLRDDTVTRGATADGYYNFNVGAGGTEYESNIRVTGCLVSDLRITTPASGSSVVGVQVEGYESSVSNCYLEKIYAVDSNTSPVGTGVWVRGIHTRVLDVRCVDAGNLYFVYGDQPPSAAQVDVPPNRVAPSTVVRGVYMSSQAPTGACKYGIYLDRDNVSVSNVQASEVNFTTSTSTVIRCLGRHTSVTENHIFGGVYDTGIYVGSAVGAEVVNNRVVAPRGPSTGSNGWTGIYTVITSSGSVGSHNSYSGRSGIRVSGNYVRMASTSTNNFPIWTAGYTGLAVGVYLFLGSTVAISEVECRGNFVVGYASGTYGGTHYAYRVGNLSSTTTRGVLVDNYTDAPSSGGSSVFGLFCSLSGASIGYTATARVKCSYANAYLPTADFSLGNTYSGVVIRDADSVGLITCTLSEDVNGWEEYTLELTSGQVFRVKPAGSSYFAGAGAGKYIEFTTPGVVKIVSTGANVLQLETCTADYLFEV